MIKNIILQRKIWKLEKLQRIEKASKQRKPTDEIIEKRDGIYQDFLEMEKKGYEILEQKHWLEALNWVLGNEEENHER